MKIKKRNGLLWGGVLAFMGIVIILVAFIKN